MESSQITLSFASISGRKIEADFDGGTTTSDGGALLLRQAESKIGIVDRIVRALCDRRHQSYIDHTYTDLIKHDHRRRAPEPHLLRYGDRPRLCRRRGHPMGDLHGRRGDKGRKTRK